MSKFDRIRSTSSSDAKKQKLSETNKGRPSGSVPNRSLGAADKFQRVKSKTTIERERKFNEKKNRPKDKRKKEKKEKKKKRKHKHKHRHRESENQSHSRLYDDAAEARKKKKRTLSNSSNGRTETNERSVEAFLKNRQRILRHYKQWKQYIPFLYEFIIVHTLPPYSPSLAVAWVPKQSVHVTKKQETNSIESIACSTDELFLGCNTEHKEFISKLKFNLPSERRATSTSPPKTKYESKFLRCGTFLQSSTVQRIKVMPQNPAILSSLTASGDVIVLDAGTKDSGSQEFKLLKTLRSHSKEGYGLDWSGHTEGSLLSSCEDAVICLWDVGVASTTTKDGIDVVSPVRTFSGHKKGVGDVRWHPKYSHMFGSVSDDSMLGLWDIRAPDTEALVKHVKGHNSDINCLDFSKFDENLVVTGAGDSTVRSWDIRNLSCPTHEFKYHEKSILQVHFSPFHRNVFVTSSEDTKVCIWDSSASRTDLNEDDLLDGPPELLFLHSGHTAAVFDVVWNPNRSWTLASTAEDNIVQIWSVASPIRSSS